MIDESSLPNKRSINVALLGMLSRHLQFSVEAWTRRDRAQPAGEAA